MHFKTNSTVNGRGRFNISWEFQRFRFMASEVYQESECMKFYDSGSDMPLNLSLVGLKGRLTGIILKEFITPWVEAHQNNKWPNFTVRSSEVVLSFTEQRCETIFLWMSFFFF